MLVPSIATGFPDGQILVDNTSEASARLPERRQRNVPGHGDLGDVPQDSDNTRARLGRPQQRDREPVWPLPLFVQPIYVGLVESEPVISFHLQIRVLDLRCGHVDLDILIG
jgi:hypothetical protein